MNIQEAYEVFARLRRKEPLHHVGTVVAPNGDLAMTYARSIYNEEAWVEMRVAARKHMLPAIEIRGEAE
jgi:1,2-phenylacetyl-CoA epoxidase PaaB subunit